MLQVVAHEEHVLVTAHPVVEQELVHLRVHAPPVVEVERKEALRVHPLRIGDRRGALGMEVFGRFALHEDGVGPQVEDRPHRQDIGLHQMLQRRDIAAIRRELLVPPAVAGREGGADEHFVDRGVELHPRVAPGELAGIVGEERGKIRVLEIADPVRHTEMAEVDDGNDAEPVDLAEGFVGEGPVVAAMRQIGAVKLGSIAEIADADLDGQLQVLAPVFVVKALLHLVHPHAAVLDGGGAVLDPGGEHEEGAGHRPGLARLAETGRMSAFTNLFIIGNGLS